MEFFFLVAFLLSLLGLMALVCRFAKTDTAFVPLLTLCGVILILYGFALADRPLWAVVPLYTAGLFSLGYFLRRNRRAFRFLASPGFWCFALLSAAVALYARGKMPDQYDNYTHWALMMKTLVQTDALPKPDGLVTFTNYPPATALWGYYVMKCTAFGEDGMVAAQGMLAAACLSALFAGCRLRDVGRTAYTLLAAALMITVIPGNLENLYVDAMLGYLAAAAAALIVYHVRENSFRPLLSAGILSVLILTKPSGVFFVVCLALTELFLRLCVRDSAARWGRSFLSLIADAGIPLGMRQLYVLYENRAFGVDNDVPFDATQEGVLAGLAAKSEEFRQTFPALFLDALTDMTTLPVLIGAVLNLAVLVAVLVMLFIPKSGPRIAQLLLSVLFSAAYAAGVFLMYITLMEEGESLQLASFARYMGTGVIFQIGFCLTAVQTAPSDRALRPWGGIAYLLLFPLCFGLHSCIDAWIASSESDDGGTAIRAEARMELAEVYGEIRALIPESDERLFIIDDRIEPGYYYYIMRYISMRRYVWPLEPWCIEEDLWGEEADDCLILILHEGWMTSAYLEMCFGVSELPPGLYRKCGTELVPMRMVGEKAPSRGSSDDLYSGK